MDTGLNVLKTASKKVVHKTSEVFRNQMADEVTKSNNNKIGKEEPEKHCY